MSDNPPAEPRTEANAEWFLQQALEGQNLYHGRYSNIEVGRATALAVRESLRRYGYKIAPIEAEASRPPADETRLGPLDAPGILGGTRLDDIRARAAAGQPLKSFSYYRDNGLWDAYRPFIEEAQEDRAALLAALDAALAIPPDPAAEAGAVETLDERLRMERGWPTPNHMRNAADALDVISIPRYGDILRWVADACDVLPSRSDSTPEPDS